MSLQNLSMDPQIQNFPSKPRTSCAASLESPTWRRIVPQAAVAFTKSVDYLCNLWVAQSPEVVPEKHLLKATMALSLYMKRNCPDLTTHIHDAVFYIVNNRLGSWIREQGGWERVSSLQE